MGTVRALKATDSKEKEFSRKAAKSQRGGEVIRGPGEPGLRPAEQTFFRTH